MVRSRARQIPARARLGGRPGLLRAAVGVLLLLASTSLASVHGHHVADETHGEAGPSLVSFDPADAPHSNGPFAAADCQLCELSRRTETELAPGPDAPTLALGLEATRSLAHPAPTPVRARVRSRQAPRAPPVFSA